MILSIIYIAIFLKKANEYKLLAIDEYVVALYKYVSVN